MKIDLIHGPVDENDSGKQRNHEMRNKHSPGGFITYMSNGDDSEAIVSMECQYFSDVIAARDSGRNLFKKPETIASCGALPIEPGKGR
jgi:hypothetical protein